ncbi:hypothetical protein FQR65_LT20348 [Abscondita terminalis]|nr:hypothetical protein FQR65_LT20348 [Abscondita terminalis]
MDGLEALTFAQTLKPEVPFIMIYGHGTVETAVEATKRGQETKVLKKKVSSSKTKEILGSSDTISKIKETIERVAPTEARVLITGENGSGKELVARWLHKNQSLILTADPKSTVLRFLPEAYESELFGPKKALSPLRTLKIMLKRNLSTSSLDNQLECFKRADDIGISSEAHLYRYLVAAHFCVLRREIAVLRDTEKNLRQHIILYNSHSVGRQPQNGMTRDWYPGLTALHNKGYALLSDVLTDQECEDLKANYQHPDAYRKTVVMERYRFGKGEYKYFDYPLPDLIAKTVERFIHYSLQAVANAGIVALHIEVEFPAEPEVLLKQSTISNKPKPLY